MPQCRNRPAWLSRSHCCEGFCRSADAGATTSPDTASIDTHATTARRRNLADMSDLQWSGPHGGVLLRSKPGQGLDPTFAWHFADRYTGVAAIRVKYLIYETRDPISLDW